MRAMAEPQLPEPMMATLCFFCEDPDAEPDEADEEDDDIAAEFRTLNRDSSAKGWM